VGFGRPAGRGQETRSRAGAAVALQVSFGGLENQ